MNEIWAKKGIKEKMLKHKIYRIAFDSWHGMVYVTVTAYPMPNISIESKHYRKSENMKGKCQMRETECVCGRSVLIKIIVHRYSSDWHLKQINFSFTSHLMHTAHITQSGNPGQTRCPGPMRCESLRNRFRLSYLRNSNRLLNRQFISEKNGSVFCLTVIIFCSSSVCHSFSVS